MPPPHPRPTTRRHLLRWLHIAAAAMLATAVYAPVPVGEALRPVLQVVVIPVTALSGVVLWKQAALRRLVRSRRPIRRPLAG